MSNDNKTLADVQPGGMVRLGDGREPMLESMWVEIRREGDRTFPRVMTKDQAEAFLRTCNVGPLPTIHPLYAALAAQPSPGGQDALVTDEMVQAACKVWAETPGQGEDWMRSALEAALAARQPAVVDLPESLHDRVEALREVAARQPVGVPVAWMTHHDEPMLFPTAAEAAAYCEDDEQPVPLYAAPAQAVDLGQFREVMSAVNARLQDVISDSMMPWSERDKASKEQAALYPLLALIDGRAVGK
ncbi:hypothetical protein [Stenotrophomonas sepilia]|uniref:hypothetical protein n=1 Tax=Stenotrophomonas sepilia TaxID=2860290 RepID=UPI003EE71ACF